MLSQGSHYVRLGIFIMNILLHRMGKLAGQILNGVRHQIVYNKSPYELRPFAGFFSEGVGNLVRRFFDQVFYIAPSVAFFGSVYWWMDKKHVALNRKNPKDFEDEV